MAPKPTDVAVADATTPQHLHRPLPSVHDAEAERNSPGPMPPREQEDHVSNDDDDDVTTRTTTKKKKKIFYYKNKPSEEEVRLPDDFQPCPKSVVMKQGTNTNGYLGNQRLKAIVASKGHLYEKASSRKERTHVVSLIIQEHFAQGGGPFVCWDRPRKAWFLACDMQRREKVGALLRDYHHTKYKSSTTAKVSKQRIDRREARSRFNSNSTTPENANSNVGVAPDVSYSSSSSSVSSSSKGDTSGGDTAVNMTDDDETDFVSKQLLRLKEHHEHQQGGDVDGDGVASIGNGISVWNSPPPASETVPPVQPQHHSNTTDASFTISPAILRTPLAPRTSDTTTMTVDAAKALAMADVMMINQEESNGVAPLTSLNGKRNRLLQSSHSVPSPTRSSATSPSLLSPSSRAAVQSPLFTANTIQALTAASTATSMDVSPKQHQVGTNSSSLLFAALSKSPTNACRNNKASSTSSLLSPPLSSFHNVPSPFPDIAPAAYASNEARIAQLMIQQQQQRQQQETIASLSQMNHAQKLMQAIAGIKRKRKRQEDQERTASISSQDDEAKANKKDGLKSISSLNSPSPLEIARGRYEQEMRYILPSFLGGSPILCDTITSSMSTADAVDDESGNPLVQHLDRCLHEYGGPDSSNLHPLLLREKKQSKRKANAALEQPSPTTSNNPFLKKRLAECLERWGESSRSSLLGRQVGAGCTLSPTAVATKTMKQRTTTSNAILPSTLLQEDPTMLQAKAGATVSSASASRLHSHAFSTNSEKHTVPNFDKAGIVTLLKPPSSMSDSGLTKSHFDDIDNRDKRPRLNEESGGRCYDSVSYERIKEGISHERQRYEQQFHVTKKDVGTVNQEELLMTRLAKSGIPNPLLEMESSSPNESMPEEAVALLDFGRAVANNDYAKQQQRAHLERERQRRTTDEAKAAAALATFDGGDSTNKKRGVIDLQDAILTISEGCAAQGHAVDYACLQRQQHVERQHQQKHFSAVIANPSSATILPQQECSSSVASTTSISPNHGFTRPLEKPRQKQTKHHKRKDATGTCNDPFSIAKESSLHKNLLLAIEKDLADLQSNENPKSSVLPRSHRVKTSNVALPANKKKTAATISPSPPHQKKSSNQTEDRTIVNLGSTTKPMGPNDILCGRYKYAYNHIGNKRFRTLIDSYLDRYLQAHSRKRDRMELIRLIVRQLEEIGARFLRPINHKQWNPDGENYVEELKDSEIREKVGHALRDLAVQKKNVLMSEWNNIKAGEAKMNKQANQSVANAVSTSSTAIAVKKENEGIGTSADKRPSTLASFLSERGMGPVEFEVAKHIEKMRKASTQQDKEEPGGNLESVNIYEKLQRRDSAKLEKETTIECGNTANTLLSVAKSMEEKQNSSPIQYTCQNGPSGIGGKGSDSLHALVAKRFHEKQRIQEGQRKLEAMIAQRIQEERMRSNSGSSSCTITRMWGQVNDPTRNLTN